MLPSSIPPSLPDPSASPEAVGGAASPDAPPGVMGPGPAQRLTKAIRAEDGAAVAALIPVAGVRFINPNGSRPSVLALALEKSDAMAELVLSHGADPYFPADWIDAHPSAILEPAIRASTSAVNAAMLMGKWSWVERFVQQGIPKDLRQPTFDSWIRRGLQAGMPLSTFMVVRSAYKKNQWKSFPITEALSLLISGWEPQEKTIEDYALLLKKELPRRYFSEWALVISSSSKGDPRQKVKPLALRQLVRLWAVDAAVQGMSDEQTIKRLASWARDAIPLRAPRLLKSVFAPYFAGVVWAKEDRQDWFKAVWNGRHASDPPIKENLSILRQMLGQEGLRVAASGYFHHASVDPWDSVLYANYHTSTMVLDGFCAQVKLLKDIGLELPAERRASWLGKVLNMKDVNYFHAWENQRGVKFVEVLDSIGIPPNFKSDAGESLEDFLAKITRPGAVGIKGSVGEQMLISRVASAMRALILEREMPALDSVARVPRPRF